jgi:hypothetical protein
MDTESNTCSELREVTARASRFSEQITQHRVMVAQLREYIVENFDDLGEHAEPIAEIFSIDLTKSVEVEVKVTYSLTVTVPLGWTEDEISENLRYPEGFESDDNDMCIESESADMDHISVY